MTDHIQATIKELRARAERIEQAIALLQEMEASPPASVVTATEAQAVPPIKPRKQLGNGRSGYTQKMKLAIAAMPETFGAAELAAATGVDAMRCNNFLNRAILWGWITRESHGVYVRVPSNGSITARGHELLEAIKSELPKPYERGED